MNDPEKTIRDDRAEDRYEMETAGGTAVLGYDLQGDRIVFTHTEVPPADRNQGLGGRLVRYGLEDARERELKVVAQCSFVAEYIGEHPEYRGLLAQS
ncbi:GNAT family N-acetyltransferase [soil metagenome]